MKISLELQPCRGQMSGIGIYTYELAKRLTNTDTITFYGNLFNFLNKDDISSLCEHIPFDITKNRMMPYGIYRRIWHILPIPYQFLFQNNCELHHFFNYIVPPHISGKVITTIHDVSFLLFPETLAKKNLTRILKDIDYSINRSDIIITVSENAKREIINHLGVEENKIKIIYNASSPLISTLSLEYLQKKFKFHQNYILYVGNLEPRKNIPSLIHAYYKLLKETNLPYQLVIAGQRGWHYETIFDTVSKLGLEQQIVFTDYISQEDKAAFYQNASLFVFPSFYEGFGIPILEAMSAKVPVICSNTSSMPEVAGNAAVLINPKDIDSIASSMYQLLTNKELRTQKIELGKIQAEKFSWDKSAEKLVEIYKSLK